MNVEILTANDQVISIDITDADIIEHFMDSNNCTEVILKQINEERIYDKIFDGESDLTILDIGANIGLFSLYASGYAQKIYCVEPTPGHFSKLTRMTSQFKDKIMPLNFAISDQDGTMDFYISSINPTQNSLISNWRSSDEVKISVKTKTIKSLLDDQNISHVDIVKCDIEGGEIIALTEQTISEVKDIVECWYVEVHQTDNTIAHGDSVRKNLAQLTQVFNSCGYSVQQIGFDNLWVWRDDHASH